MKIIKTQHWTEQLELTRPYRIAGITFSDVENHFVRIELQNGLCGYGAASPASHVTGESLQDTSQALDEHLDATLKGRDLRALPALLKDLQSALREQPAALAAADMALHDLAARLLEAPLVDLLGRSHQSLATSITMGIKPVDEALAEAREYLGMGFMILKVKIGDHLEQDIELIKRLREEVGPRIGIRVDANQGYSALELLKFHKHTKGLGLELIEQPLKAGQLDEMRGLPRELRELCAGDESLKDPADALECAHAPPPFGIYNIKLMKCGGVDPALQIARIAGLAGISLMWGCNDESCVSIAAALHAALACPGTRYLDLDGSLDLGRDLLKGGFALKDGMLSTTDAPGLGVTPLD